MATTHRRHFDEDIARAEAILATARSRKGDARLPSDLRLSAVSMAVGAMDAYLCDAYVDCLTAVLRAYVTGQWKDDHLPSHYAKQQLPAGEVLDSSRRVRPLWSLRMAARSVMERGNMLTMSRVPEQFNGVLPDSHKLWVGLIDRLIGFGYKRLTGVTGPEVNKLSGKPLEQAKKRAIKTFFNRISDTIQIRHDWAHNCGRPKTAIKTFSHAQARDRIREIRLFVTAFDDHLQQHRKV
jgi:hypothetical protein